MDRVTQTISVKDEEGRVHMIRLAGEVADFRCRKLHSRGQLIGGNAGAELVVAVVGRGVRAVELVTDIAGRAISFRTDARRPGTVAERLLRGHRHSLVPRGKKSSPPNRLSVGRPATNILHGDIGRQVFVQ